MRAAITDGKGNVWVGEAPMPVAKEYQCLCKIQACATCTGTDQKHIHNKLPWQQQYPGLLGHESVGRVVELGPKVRYLKPGDVVLRPAAVYPGEKLGEYTSMWGGFAEYGIATDVRALREDQPDAKPNNYTRFQQIVPADVNITAVEATTLITLKECASYVMNVGATMFKSVVVLGAGSVGMSMCKFAKIFGAHPLIAVARRDEQLDYVVKIGANHGVNATKQDPVKAVKDLTGGRGADVLIDTTGDIDFVVSMVGAVAPEGKIATYATYKAGVAMDKVLDPARLVRGVGTGEDTCHAYMMDAVRMGIVKPSEFYSHRLPLSLIREGFEMIKKKIAFKVVFEMEG